MNHDELFEQLATAVVLVDYEWYVLYLNASAENLLAVSARQALEIPLIRLIPGLASLQAPVAQAIARGSACIEREHRLAVSTERSLTVNCSITPIAGQRVLLELEALDHHLRISREAQLIAQNRAIRELIHGLAHEIKNPLGGLRGAAQLLESQLARAEQREYTQIIIAEADRLRALVDGLLGPERKRDPVPTNLHEVLERVRQLAQAEAAAGVTIARDYDPSIPLVPASPDALIQALLNLVRNALTAVGESGCITVQTRSQRRCTVGETLHKLVARIDVIDDGPGIPPALQERIFYPMVTGGCAGSGLGLPIAQTLINQHGGVIECVSRPGETVFTVWLPLEDADV